MRDLPVEIWLIIFQQLAKSSKLTELRNIALVCKEWQRLQNDDSLWRKVAKDYLSNYHNENDYDICKATNIKQLFYNTLIVDKKRPDPRNELRAALKTQLKSIDSEYSNSFTYSYDPANLNSTNAPPGMVTQEGFSIISDAAYSFFYNLSKKIKIRKNKKVIDKQINQLFSDNLHNYKK